MFSSRKTRSQQQTTASTNRSRAFRHELDGLDAWSRHKYFVDSYLKVYDPQGADLRRRKIEAEKRYKTEFDVLRENHEFLRTEAESGDELTWEQRVAKKYYDRLFKEYCISELRAYREGKIALRWRTQKEAVSGKGQFSCGALRCESRSHLTSWEVNFTYLEQAVKKSALVKLRLCPSCSEKLHFGKSEEYAPRKSESSTSHGNRSESCHSGKEKRRRHGNIEEHGTDERSEKRISKSRTRRKDSSPLEDDSSEAHAAEPDNQSSVCYADLAGPTGQNTDDTSAQDAWVLSTEPTEYNEVEATHVSSDQETSNVRDRSSDHRMSPSRPKTRKSETSDSSEYRRRRRTEERGRFESTPRSSEIQRTSHSSSRRSSRDDLEFAGDHRRSRNSDRYRSQEDIDASVESFFQDLFR